MPISTQIQEQPMPISKKEKGRERKRKIIQEHVKDQKIKTSRNLADFHISFMTYFFPTWNPSSANSIN